jgi:hypothetical protein
MFLQKFSIKPSWVQYKVKAGVTKKFADVNEQ